MRLILLDGRDREDSEPLIAYAATHLGRYGVRLEHVRSGKAPRLPYERYAALIATAEFPLTLRDRLDCYGKSDASMPSRAETLEWLEQAGLPTMRWRQAECHRELDRLFDSWESDALLLKRSDTYGGDSVTLFTRDRASELQWDPRTDVFCPEVNPFDGDVYKLELFGSRLLLGWVSRTPPARTRLREGMLCGLFGAYGERELFDWPESILTPARAFGEAALDRGFGHLSLDFMRDREGGFQAIEVNLGNIALWWTSQFVDFRRNYAGAVHQVLAERHGASSTQVKAPLRLGRRLLSATRTPVLLVRELQAARFRRRYYKGLAEHGPGARRPW